MQVNSGSKPTNSLDKILKKIIRELEAASERFPNFNSQHEGYAILKEEVDEMWEEIKLNNRKHARQECIQVAAMAIRFLMDV